MGGWIDRQIDIKTNGQRDGRMDGWMEEWVYKRMDSGRMERMIDGESGNNIQQKFNNTLHIIASNKN